MRSFIFKQKVTLLIRAGHSSQCAAINYVCQCKLHKRGFFSEGNSPLHEKKPPMHYSGDRVRNSVLKLFSPRVNIADFIARLTNSMSDLFLVYFSKQMFCLEYIMQHNQLFVHDTIQSDRKEKELFTVTLHINLVFFHPNNPTT